MPNIISNTSCLIVLDNIDALSILKKLYQTNYLTEEVAQEFGKPLESWMTVIDKNYLRILNASVDLGEASTIACRLGYFSVLCVDVLPNKLLIFSA